MEKTTLLSLFIMLFFIQWHSIDMESNDTVEAKVIGAMNEGRNEFMDVVKDENAKSGWAVDVKKADEHENDFYVEFFTKTDPKTEFDRAGDGLLFHLLELKDKKEKYLPSQIIGMIFPTQKKILKVEKAAILDTAQVNYLSTERPNIAKDYDYYENEKFLPRTTPYEMEVHIKYLYQSMSNNTGYIFKVNFNIGGDINKT